jgi:hypothetical protein
MSHKLSLLDSHVGSLPRSGTKKNFIIAKYKGNNEKLLKSFLHKTQFSQVKLI